MPHPPSKRSKAVDVDGLPELLSPSRRSEFVTTLCLRLALDHGAIDPKSMNEEEMACAAVFWVCDQLDVRDVGFVLDHREDLLRHARIYRRRQALDFSALFFALWIEHTVNHMLVHALSGKTKLVVEKILRANFQDKTTWIWELCGLASVPKAHLSRLQAIIDRRNEFVHFKWRDTDERAEGRLSIALRDIEKAVRYLNRRSSPLSDRTIKAIARRTSSRRSAE
jgi:hypothetical protein